MKTFFLTIMMLCSLLSFGQNISIGFSASGVANEIDSVRATNLTTNQSVTLPGNETLVLSVSTGVPSVSELAHLGMVFPNPFSGWTTITYVVEKAQTVWVNVLNMAGRLVAQTKASMQPGEHTFSLSVKTPGIYAINLTTSTGTTCYKVICMETCESSNNIEYLSTRALNSVKPSVLAQTKLKSSIYMLGFTKDDVIHYTCKSGRFVTILTDSPKASKNYEVEFIACTDPDDKDYPIVKIGNQTWMAENLAYLPAVNGSWAGSRFESYYYVLDYEGADVHSAKASPYYADYGVFYNWPASLTVCPTGWHLPGNDEWSVLTSYLTNNGYGFDGSGDDIGKSLASTSGWDLCDVPGTAGNDQTKNNSSGFSALPSGGRLHVGGFWDFSRSVKFWTANESDSLNAFCRGMLYNYSGFGDGSGLLDKRFGFPVRCIRGAKPTASFSVSPESGITDTIFQFDPSASKDPETSTNELFTRWDWIGDE